MPALTQLSVAKPNSLSSYEESVSYWLRGLRAEARNPALRRAVGRQGTHRGELAKRAMDVAGATLLLALLTPLTAVLLALVWVGGGSPLFGHERVGRGGKRFLCWKIRTMVPDAPERLEAVLRSDPALAAEWGRDHKLRHDPRVTRLGRFLRLTSLDEVPQLWNVLLGEMSLVGPRPVTAAELTKYGPAARHYLAVLPGLTGMWQLEGRNDIPYSRRVLLDRYYVMTRSISLDFGLLCKTPVALIRRTGR
jgi:exopolysaccharide production protein ExoY